VICGRRTEKVALARPVSASGLEPEKSDAQLRQLFANLMATRPVAAIDLARNSSREVPSNALTNKNEDCAGNRLRLAQREERAMYEFLQANHLSFTPEKVKLMAEAFNIAWPIVRAKAGIADRNIEAARLVLAKRIVDLASHGDYDRQSLSDTAIASMAESA
jgi:hypothetical protein